MELSIASTLQQAHRCGHIELAAALPHRQFTLPAASRVFTSATRTARPLSLNLGVHTSYCRPARSTRAAWRRQPWMAARLYFALGHISIVSKSGKSNGDSHVT